MAINLDLFSTANFRSTIQRYCEELRWNISDINNRRVILQFRAASGNSQTLFIIRYDNTLEFSVPSGLKFKTEEEVPGWMSTMLMCKNSELKFGFWAMEEIENKKTFSIMHNAEISLINIIYFEQVVSTLILECDNFEQAIIKVLAA
jgi:hypothetical protein